MAWAPEIAVDRELARRLIGSQFPELELRSLELIGEGWDNTVWLVDGEWAFRFPRRAVAVPLVERELAVLPRIAPLVSAPVPVPQLPRRAARMPSRGRTSALASSSETSSAVYRADESALARDLGAFLAGLHAARIDAELPVDPNRRMDMARRVEIGPGPPRSTHSGSASGSLRLSLARSSRRPLALTPPEHLVTAHGDLHFRHVLVERARRARRRHRLGGRVRGGSRRRPPALLERLRRRGPGCVLQTPTDRSPRTTSPAHACSRSASTRSSPSTATAKARGVVRDEALASLARTIGRLKRAPQTPSPANPRAHRT